MKLLIAQLLLAVSLAADYSYPKPSYPAPPAPPANNYPKPQPQASPSYPKPSYSEPAYSPQASYQQPSSMPMPFDFDWAVKDAPSYNDYSHKANSDGNLVTGSYRVALPDGRTQVVNYKADENGYVAEVTYE